MPRSNTTVAADPGRSRSCPTKPTLTQRDLSLAYTPGVAQAVLEIARDPLTAFEYTTRGNLVAVITNGSAILGLGNRGPLAAKPVMEGKALLFKRFADIDVFDLEIDAPDRRGDDRRLSSRRPDVRRHQPGGHRRAGLLRGRGAAARGAGHPRLPRRPARHGDHHRRRADQRPGAGRQEDRRGQGRHQRGRRGRDRQRRAVRRPRRQAREPDPVRLAGRRSTRAGPTA